MYYWEEKIDSARMQADGEGGSIVHVYEVWHPHPENIWASGMLPTYLTPHPTLPWFFADSVTIEPPTGDGLVCRVTVTYAQWPAGVTPEAENWAWDLVSQQTKITSVKNSSYQVNIPEEEDVGTAIGTDGEKTEGAQVYRPALSLQVTKKWTYIDEIGRTVLESLINTVNGFTWMDYQPGEVLYTGARIRREPDATILITYSFLIGRWVGPQPVELYDGTIIEINPGPHDWVWYRFQDKPTTGVDGTIVSRGIKSVHIAQVYDFSDFTMLGLVGPYG